MLFGNDHLFSQAKLAKQGRPPVPSVLNELRAWIVDEFGVSVVHVVFDHVDIGLSKGRPRLNVILETDADYESWKPNVVGIRPDVKSRVLARIAELAASEPQTYDTDDVFLILDNFAEECLGRACTQVVKRDAGQIIESFPNAPLWAIDGFSRNLVVFFEAEKDIAVHTKSGACAEISKCCFDAVKQYDEFGYLNDSTFRLRFDSRENLNKKYGGSLFNYWR
jgi:hypothetical protein